MARAVLRLIKAWSLLLLLREDNRISSVEVSELSIAVVTSSPVQFERLPALTWLARAQERCAALVVVSDIAVECTNTTPCTPTAQCACEASHWGLPCKTACALEQSIARAPNAKWHIRVMDDTVLDVDALAWHLSDLDFSRLWYVGEQIDVGNKFSAALGGAGWALSQPAALLALRHMPLYHELCLNMACNFSTSGQQRFCGDQEWPLPPNHLGRDISDKARGLKLMSPFADDIFWASYMSALGIQATGPHGFTQAPIDILGGVPLCTNLPQIDHAAHDNTQRVHDLGVYYSQSTGGVVAQAFALGASRLLPRKRPAAVHMGDEVGTIPSKHWRQQMSSVFEALTASNETVAIYESDLHFWRLCVTDESQVRPPLRLRPEESFVDLKLSIDGTDSKILTVSACDRADILANQFCLDANADTDQCRSKLNTLVLQALDVARGHPRPASLTVQLADGAINHIQLAPHDDSKLVAQAKCQLWNLNQADCNRLTDSLSALHLHSHLCSAVR